MLSLEQAKSAILAAIRPGVATETVPLVHACGRFLAAEARAAVDNPAFDNSAMDGYALSTADLAARDFRLPQKGEAGCGDAPGTLAAGSAMRIFTGAPLPTGADAVVIQEDVKIEDGKVVMPHSVRAGQNIRRRGEDFHEGEALYTPGRRLVPSDLALLATGGIAELPVFCKARVLVVATGNELVAPGAVLKPGQIYESNRLATLVQLQQLGVETVDGGMAPDDPEVLRALLQKAGDFDFVITSGGVSVGDRDLVKQIFSEIGEIDFWKVRIKPGKPVAFGRIGSRTHFFGLPGNPVSSLVTYKLFVEPSLYAWHHGAHRPLELPATAANDFRRRPGRREFLRARLTNEAGVLRAEALKGQGSHQIGTLRHTNGFIVLGEEAEGFAAGDTVRVLPLALDAA